MVPANTVEIASKWGDVVSEIGNDLTSGRRWFSSRHAQSFQPLNRIVILRSCECGTAEIPETKGFETELMSE